MSFTGNPRIEVQHEQDDPPEPHVSDTNDTPTHQANRQGDILEAPQPTRPRMSDRQYSTHIYALSSQHAQHLASSSGQRHIPGDGSESLPTEALVTIRPSRVPLLRTTKDVSTSSGLTINEIPPPQAMLDTAQARGLGTYRFVARVTAQQDGSSENLDAATLEKRATVDYEVHSLNDFTDKIATKEYLDELTASHPFPKAKGPEWWDHLRHGVFSTYRRLFVLVLLGNLIALLYCIRLSTQDLTLISYNGAATAVAANLFAGTLMRHEHCINFLFRFFVALPHWLPVGIRRLAAKVYSYGGVHSSCGISGLAWYIYFTVLFFLQVGDDTTMTGAIAVLAGFMLCLLVSIIIMSHPKIRSKAHNQWELIHRYFGWTCIGIIWAQIILISILNAQRSDWSVGHIIIETLAFWFLVAITALIIYPWLRLRRVHFTAEQLSSHAIRLWIHDYKRSRPLPTCMGIKLSTSPLTENHSFATIPNAANQGPGFSILVSNNGDWTKRLITTPPPHLWTRGAYTIGVMRIALLFSPLIVVATGSGIGPCLSFLQVHPSWPVRVVWSARFPEATYGKGVMESVFRADENAVVIDSRRTGKGLDLVGVVWAVREECKAEAVVVISNPLATKSVVGELERRGVPAFGAIFDS